MSGKIQRIQWKDTLEFIKLLKQWRLVRVTHDIHWNFLTLQNLICVRGGYKLLRYMEFFEHFCPTSLFKR